MQPTPHPRGRARLWAWIFFVATLVAVYVFFVLPHQMPPRQMTVTFEAPAK